MHSFLCTLAHTGPSWACLPRELSSHRFLPTGPLTSAGFELLGCSWYLPQHGA